MISRPDMLPCDRLVVTIPGDPVAQGRGRAVRFGASVRVIDPARSRSWKGAAQVHMLAARNAHGWRCVEDALFVTVRAYFKRPKSLKADASEWRPSRPDADNVAKAVLDAGIATIWADDSQVVKLTIEKRYAPVGDAPYVEVEVVQAALAAGGSRG